jgi:hypothetical protein
MILAKPSRREKRAVFIQKCPENVTYEECNAYAQEKISKNPGCYSFDLNNFIIAWKT